MISVSFSSGHANFTNNAFNPKATSSSVKDMFLAPFDFRIFVVSFSISSKSASGESGIILVIIATIDIIDGRKRGF